MIKPSNKICPRCGKGGYVNYIGQSNIYEAKCYNCGYYFAFGELDLYEEKKHITNADRIRSMTDEELAFYIVNHPMWSDESACVAWLRQESESKR